MTKKRSKPTNKRSTKKTKRVKPTLSLTNPTTIIAIIGVASIILSLKLLGMFFTLILIIGVIFIVGFSFLFSKLRKKKAWRITLNILTIIFLLICIAGLTAGVWFLNYVIKNSPEFEVSKLNRSQSTIIYDNKNEKIAELGTEKREIISFSEMSQTLVDALIATEDSRFYQHNGFDAARFFKAGIGQVAGNSNAGGGSTLSMQVIKNSFTSTEASGFEGIVRKFTDIYLSIFKLEKNYTKEEIIEFYVNNHFLGSNAYGVEQAAQTYFGKSASQLNLAESSLIAGLFQAPTYYNPFTNPKGASERRDTVLKLMHRHGYISKEEMEMAKAIPVESLLVDDDKSASTPYQAYIDTVVEEIIDKYKVNPHNTSLLIYTNMDTKKQAGLDDIFSGKNFKWENKIVQAGIAAVDVKTGKIIAIGAGRNRTDARSYNYATMIDNQIGSTAKPIFDYAPGMEYNNWSTYELFLDAPYTYSDGKQIRNSDRGYMGMISLRTSLAQSRNIPALKAFQSVNNKKIIDMVTKMGIEPEISNGKIHEAHSIGAFDGSNPLQMAAAYATFANGGYYNEPYSVSKIVFRDSGETVEHKSESVKVMSDSTAYMITDCLISAVKDGVSNGAAIKNVNVAAKTGTTNYDEKTMKDNGLPNGAVNDAWIVGYDPNTALSLWYGYDKINKKYYSTTTSAVVQRSRLYKAAGNVIFEKNNKEFKVPDSVVKVAIEKGSNPARLASASTPESQITYEYFKKGAEPTETSSTYTKLSNVSNLKATYDEANKKVTLNWSKATSLDDAKENWGRFGYKVYKDNKYLGFTADNSYTITNIDEPSGTYKVVTAYEDYGSKNSSGAKTTLAINKPTPPPVALYTSELLVNKTKNYIVGSTLDSSDSNPSANDIRIYENGIDITTNCNISTIITNEQGAPATISTDTPNTTFTISYSITYNGNAIIQPITRTITITEPTQ